MPHDGDDDDVDGGGSGGDDDGGGGDDGSSGGGDDGIFSWSHQIQPVVLGAFRPSKIRRTLTSLDRSKIDPSLLGFKDWLNVKSTILFVLNTLCCLVAGLGGCIPTLNLFWWFGLLGGLLRIFSHLSSVI